MLRSITLLFFLLVVLSVNAQEDKDKRKLNRQERKELRKKQKAKDEKTLAQLVNNKRFVLEANIMYDKYGHQIRVNRMINFVAIDSSKAAFQFGSASNVGVNNLGGVTIEGPITKYNLKTTYTGKSPMYNLEILIMSRNDVITINMSITSLKNARAIVKNTRGDRLIYSGEIVEPEKSRTFKGYYAH